MMRACLLVRLQSNTPNTTWQILVMVKLFPKSFCIGTDPSLQVLPPDIKASFHIKTKSHQTIITSAANMVHIQCEDYLYDKLNRFDHEYFCGAKHDESLKDAEYKLIKQSSEPLSLR